MPYNVSTADVEARWRVLSDDEASVAAILLDDLVTELDLLRPALSAFLIDLASTNAARATLLERVIVKTLALAVKRALRNPDTLTSTNIQPAGGIAVGYDNDADHLANTAAGLNAADLAQIDKATTAVGGDAPSSVGSVRLQAYPERVRVPDVTILPTP